MTNDQINQLRAALDHLDNGENDKAHTISQALGEVPLGNAVHAIVHRRDGDFSNSLHWWRIVGDDIPVKLRELYGGDAAEFVRRCESAKLNTPEAAAVAQIENQETPLIRSLLPSEG